MKVSRWLKIFNIHKNKIYAGTLSLFFFAIVCVSKYYSNKIVCYTGENNVISVNFSRYQDYDEFLNNKSNDIIIYNDISEIKQEKRKNPKLTFISGNLKIKNEIFNIINGSEKKLKLMNNGKAVSSVTLMMPHQNQSLNNETEIPFISSDYNNSNINRVDVTLDDKIISSLKIKIKYM